MIRACVPNVLHGIGIGIGIKSNKIARKLVLLVVKKNIFPPARRISTHNSESPNSKFWDVIAVHEKCKIATPSGGYDASHAFNPRIATLQEKTFYIVIFSNFSSLPQCQNFIRSLGRSSFPVVYFP
jgi:hypothetical protein